MFQLTRAAAEAHIDDLRREAERMAAHGVARQVRRRRRRGTPLPLEFAVTLRYASPDDELPLARLAALDGRRVPAGPVLLAEVEGELRAAMALRDGYSIADPFRPTTGLLQLLIARGAQLRGRRVRFRRLRQLARLTAAAKGRPSTKPRELS